MSPSRKRKPTRASHSAKLVLFKQIFIGLVCFLILGLFGYGVWYISHLESLNIKTVQVSGGQTIKHTEVRDTALSLLEGSYYKLVPKSFSWTYPKAAVIEAVDAIPRVKSVMIDEIDGNTLQIQVEEYLPYALWCNSYGYECLFIDDDGYAFAPAPALSGSAFMRYEKTAQLPELDTSLTDKTTIDKTALMIKRLDTELNFSVSYVELGDRGVVTYHLIDGGSLKTIKDQESDELIENLSAILASEEFNHLHPGNFQYIDLRFGEKVFINEEMFTEDEATSTEEVIE